MGDGRNMFRLTEETSFVVLRALAMLGGLTAVFSCSTLRSINRTWAAWPGRLWRTSCCCSWRSGRGWPACASFSWPPRCWISAFVALFVWFGGGLESHFYLLFYLLVALAAVHFGPGVGIATAGGASVAYAVASAGVSPHHDWTPPDRAGGDILPLGWSLGISEPTRAAGADRGGTPERGTEGQSGPPGTGRTRSCRRRRSGSVQSERLATIGQMSAKVSPRGAESAELDQPERRALGGRTVVASATSVAAEARHLVRAIRSQVDVLSAVTEGYLRFARLPKPKLEVASLEPVIADLADFVREELRARKVQLVVDVQPGLPTLRVDAGQIRQALLNLIRNAAEAMPDGGTISLAAQACAAMGNRATGQAGRSGSESKSDVRAGSCGLPNRQIAKLPRRRMGRGHRHRYGCGHRAGGSGESVRAILYEQGGWDRSGPGHLARDRRGARRDTHLRECARERGHLPVDPSGRQRWRSAR